MWQFVAAALGNKYRSYRSIQIRGAGGSDRDDRDEDGETWSVGLTTECEDEKNSFLEIIGFATLLSSHNH